MAEEEEEAPPEDVPEAEAEAEAAGDPIVEDQQSFISTRTEPLSTDPFTTEFMYYTSVLKILGPLSNEQDRKIAIPWIRKLFRPEYHTTKLREKRNKYLSYLTISLLLDEIHGNFREQPPEGPLPDVSKLQTPKVMAASWELDKMWQDTLKCLPANFKMLECSVHKNKASCDADHHLDNILDQEFQFFLHVVRPYAALLMGHDQTRIAAWLQVLCSIHGKECCSGMKAIRNDYIMALMAYLNDLRAVGPFADYPPLKTLPCLVDMAKKLKDSRPITDPTHPDVDQFLCNQPLPDDGAFCYIAITGDLVDHVQNVSK